MTISARFAMLGICLLVCFAGGCASPWETNYRGNDRWAGKKFAPTSSVEVRTVEYERFRKYAEQERQRRVESKTAPEDLSAEEQTAAKNRLLETLQLKERGDEILILGWSEFAADRQLDPHDPQLKQFAEKVGADYVVIGSTYTGRITSVQDRPVTTYAHGYETFTRPGRRGTIITSYSDQSTVWVPTQVTEDRYFHQAFFLRKPRPGDPVSD